MSKLDDFLGLGDVSDITKEIKVNVQGKEFLLKIRAMTSDEHSEFQKRAMAFRKQGVNFDVGKYNALLISNCIVEPNFNNSEFLSKVHCVSAWDFLKKKIPAGILVDIANEIQNLSGFATLEEEIENAKN